MSEGIENRLEDLRLMLASHEQRRFTAAVAAMTGLLASPAWTLDSNAEEDMESLAANAVNLADKLLAALAEGEKP